VVEGGIQKATRETMKNIFRGPQKIQHKSGKNSQVHDFPSEYERMGRYQSSVYRSTRQSSPGAKCLGRERVDP
jgi:hypothetical protein